VKNDYSGELMALAAPGAATAPSHKTAVKLSPEDQAEYAKIQKRLEQRRGEPHPLRVEVDP
jgi:hypothetical protein